AKPAAAPAPTRAKAVPETADEPAAEAPAEVPDESGPPPPASPDIRRMARELGINLRRIRGSESGGRIVMADLRAYVQRLEKLAATPKNVAGAQPAPPPAESVDFSQWGPITRKPRSSLRKTISRRMSQSWNAVPRVTQFD